MSITKTLRAAGPAVLAALALLALPVLGGAQERVAARPQAPAAQVDYFLKLPGVEGEARAEGHEDEIEILSWSWGETRDDRPAARAAPPAPAPPAGLQDLTLTKIYDKASPKLMEHCAKGKVFPSVELSLRQPDGSVHAYELEKVRITSYSIHSGGEAPTETISLNFGKIEHRPGRTTPEPRMRGPDR